MKFYGELIIIWLSYSKNLMIIGSCMTELLIYLDLSIDQSRFIYVYIDKSIARSLAQSYND